jgi:aspartyl-tRNA(Asn)/glutamyl-tRNA(Gln) amidotransferase subunit A
VLLHQQKLSPVEVTTECLDRIRQLQPDLNAFITVLPEASMDKAKAAEVEIRKGDWKSALHGVPIAVKDFYDTAGIPTTAAFEHFRTRVPSKDAASVETLKNAGAILIGKTNMHTLGMGTTGLESYFGPVKNPWNHDYIPGGSSSGSAAGVASGMCYATLDTDAIGSCRLPAACCGVVGFKGTYGLISMQGILAGEKPPEESIVWMSHAGLKARAVEDVAVLLGVLGNQPAPAITEHYYQDLHQPRRLRVAVAENYTASGEILPAFRKAVEAIRVLGHTMTSASAPTFDFRTGIENIETDRKTVAERYFRETDLFLLPTIPTKTPRVEAATNPQALSSTNTIFANYYGLPAISLPCGRTEDGLPIGLQIVGRPWEETAVLRLAYEYQTAWGHGKGRSLV